MIIVTCRRCGRRQRDDPNVKAVLVCTCGAVVSFPADPWGPGNRPRDGDIRLEGTRGEREDQEELRR